MKIIRGLFLFILIVLAQSAIGSAQGGQASTGKTYTIRIKNFQFVPASLEVAKGDTVTWINDDIVPHTATEKGVFDSKGLDQGKSWTYTAAKSGSYPYICTYHPTMKGQLVVK